MLRNLSTKKYQSRDKNPALLLHSTGHYPADDEIDTSIIYADYYYIEALMMMEEDTCRTIFSPKRNKFMRSGYSPYEREPGEDEILHRSSDRAGLQFLPIARS